MTVDEKLAYVKENILEPKGVTNLVAEINSKNSKCPLQNDNELYKEVEVFAKVFQYFNETYYTKLIGTAVCKSFFRKKIFCFHIDQSLIDLVGVITNLQKYTSFSTQEQLQVVSSNAIIIYGKKFLQGT